MCQIEVSFICSIRIFSDRETLELLGTVPLVFICDYCKCRRLSEPYFLSFGWRLSSFFHVCIATYILQFSTGTVHLVYVTVTQCYFMNYKPPSCLLFHTLPFCCVDCHNSFFSWKELSHFSLCECQTNILVSPLSLSGHSTLFPFGS